MVISSTRASEFLGGRIDVLVNNAGVSPVLAFDTVMKARRSPGVTPWCGRSTWRECCMEPTCLLRNTPGWREAKVTNKQTNKSF